MEWNVHPANFVSQYMHYKNQITVLDVREEYEYEQYYLPGSMFVPLDDLHYKINKIPSNKPIYVICEHGIRSIQATMILYDAGYHDVYNVMGGFEKVLASPDLTIEKSPAS